MATFKVLLQRVGLAEVTIEAESAADVRRQLADEDLIHELFHSAGNQWYTPEIKIKAVGKVAE